MNENFETLIQEKDYVSSSNDFELDIQRENQVEYLYSYPKLKNLNGIVFIIPGFGGDTNSEYSQKLRDYIAQTFSVVAVHVIYHCFHSRVKNGATVSLDKRDEDILLRNLRDIKKKGLNFNDEIALPEEKVEFYKTLNKLGFDTKLNMISEEAEVDGKFIKSLKHGLDMSIKELAKRELPNALKLRNPSVADEIAPISYECNTIKYGFEIINDVFSATQSPLKNIEESIVERYQKNIQYFQEKQPKLYEKLASCDSAVEQGLYTNKYDLMFNNNSFDVQEFTTNNRLYGQDSNKFAYEIAQNFSEKVEKFAFFGVGLGVHLTAIDKKISSSSYLIVEDDLELFKLSTLVTPYYELAYNSKLYFSVFESEDEFKDEVDVFLNSTKTNTNILHYSMSNHSDTKKIYFNKIFGKENE